MVRIYVVIGVIGVLIMVIMVRVIFLLVSQCSTCPNLQWVKSCYGSICSAIHCPYICSSHYLVLAIDQALNNSQLSIIFLTVIVYECYVTGLYFLLIVSTCLVELVYDVKYSCFHLERKCCNTNVSLLVCFPMLWPLQM